MSETDKTTTITWLSGVTTVIRETRVEGNDLVFGYRLDGGEFKPTVRMTCEDSADLALAVKMAKEIR